MSADRILFNFKNANLHANCNHTSCHVTPPVLIDGNKIGMVACRLFLPKKDSCGRRSDVDTKDTIYDAILRLSRDIGCNIKFLKLIFSNGFARRALFGDDVLLT